MLRSEGQLQTGMQAPAMPRTPATAPNSSHHMHRMMDTPDSANHTSSRVRCCLHLCQTTQAIGFRAETEANMAASAVWLRAHAQAS